MLIYVYVLIMRVYIYYYVQLFIALRCMRKLECIENLLYVH